MDVVDVDVLAEEEDEGGHGAEDEEKEGGEELVDGERLWGTLLLHVGLAHPVQPEPSQALKVSILP